MFAAACLASAVLICACSTPIGALISAIRALLSGLDGTSGVDDATGVEVTGVDAEGAVAAGGGVVGSGIGVGVTGVGAAAEGAAGAVATVGKSFERFELEEVFVDEAEAEAD